MHSDETSQAPWLGDRAILCECSKGSGYRSLQRVQRKFLPPPQDNSRVAVVRPTRLVEVHVPGRGPGFSGVCESRHHLQVPKAAEGLL